MSPVSSGAQISLAASVAALSEGPQIKPQTQTIPRAKTKSQVFYFDQTSGLASLIMFW